MCEFFSFVTNGKGKIFYFKEEDIINIEKEGNKDNLEYNSHASICTYYNINEDKMNKYEFNPDTNKFKVDQINAKNDDSNESEKWVKSFWKDSKLFYIKLCKKNSGNWNSGYRNSGNWNSGNWNSGNWNSGYRNSGYRNSGNGNSGDGNSGNRNSGDGNSGNWNSGNGNSGNWNSGNGNSGYLNTDQPKLMMFNKLTKKQNIEFPNYFYFDLNIWVYADNMTTEEKSNNKDWETLGGYLKKQDYKEAWLKSFNNDCDKEQAQKTIELPNFKYKLFEEISGITRKMLQDKLKG
jgi:hypothetical protein